MQKLKQDFIYRTVYLQYISVLTSYELLSYNKNKHANK